MTAPGTPVGKSRTAYKRVQTKDADLNRVQDAVKTAFGAVDDQVNQHLGALVPIGAVLPWHKSLAGTPALPVNFLECNGQTIVDTRSPMNGQATPNLNAQLGGLFLRGGNASGAQQAASAVVPAHAHAAGTLTSPAHAHGLNSHTHDFSHTHGFALPPHQHQLSTASGTNAYLAATAVGNNTLGNTGGVIGVVNGSTNSQSTTNTGVPSTANTATDGSAAVTGSTATDGGSGAETRPVNMAMVFIMRIF